MACVLASTDAAICCVCYIECSVDMEPLEATVERSTLYLARLAQLAEATDLDSVGSEFESQVAHQTIRCCPYNKIIRG